MEDYTIYKRLNKLERMVAEIETAMIEITSGGNMKKKANDVLVEFIDKIHHMNFLTKKEITKDMHKRDILDAIENQAKRVLEEAQETIDACKAGDIEGVLDGIVDVQVTALPLISMGKAYGFDVDGALIEVADNNLTKVTTSYIRAVESVAKYGEGSVYIDEQPYMDRIYFSIKRKSDDKYLKPVGYESVSLEKYLPDE